MAEKSGLTKKDAGVALEAFTAAVEDALKAGKVLKDALNFATQKQKALWETK